jgi:hypothetical protein
MTKDVTLTEVVGLIARLATKLEAISDKLDDLRSYDRIDSLEDRIRMVERAIVGLDDLRNRMYKIEAAVCKNKDCENK